MRTRILLATLLAALAGCSGGGEAPAPESLPETFGLAVRGNMEAQIIAEEGEVQTLAPAPGVRRALAAGRYQTDQVEQPVKLFTRGN